MLIALENVVISKKKLTSLVVKKLTEVNIPENDAIIVADVLVHANLRNVNSHGVLRTEHYVERIKKGGINKNPNISIKETGLATAIVDGDDGLGHVVTKIAMDYVIQQAKTTGVSFAGVINSSHGGALSYFVNEATKEDMIGIAMTHTDKFVVPFGGKEPFLGTNPLAFGFPADKHKPILLDMATSNAALGKIIHAKEVGEKIPDNWGVDENGFPTTNPNDVKALLSVGGPKGYGLGLVVDILSGILTGSAFGPYINPMYEKLDKKRKLGHFVGVINPDFFSNINDFKENIDKLIDDLHQSPANPNFDKVMVPGEPEQLFEEDRVNNGIPIPKTIYEYLIS